MVKPTADGKLNTDTSRDLDVVWSDVLKEYSRITETPLSNEDSFDSLIKRVNAGIDESSSKNKSKAKDVLNKAATCIQKFGGMIAQAASIVFGPAGQCYNAISFVISAAKGIQEVIDGYITLLEHCVAFLQRITLKLEGQRLPGEERLPLHLRGPAYQGLELFLKVQAHSRNLAKSKRTKLKMFCGVVLFSDDDGVKGNLATLTELSTTLTDYTVDEILEDVKGLARYMQKSDEERQEHEAECREHFKALGLLTQQTLDSSEKTRALVGQLKSSSEDSENLKKIESALKAVTDNKDVSERRWMDQHKAIQRERIAGTGKWLLESQKFKLWSNIGPHDKLSVLKGNGGFGKSFLCSHIVDNILTYSKEAPNGRSYVAYYYFEKGYSVEDCIGSLVYQWAALDKTYRRAVASICPLAASSSSKTKLWKTLVTDLAGSMQGHYFMVIDGYPGDDDSHVMREIIQHSVLDETSSIRLFLTGRYEDLESLDGVLDTPLLHRLGEGRPGLQRQMSRPLTDTDLDDPIPRSMLANDQDLMDYAINRIEGLCKKNPDLKATLQDPKRNIATKFARGARGDYTSLESKLNEIAEAQDNDAIEEIISRAGETRKESCDRVLKDLYDILTVEEIRELNILLKWVYEGKESDEKLLNAVLLWSTGKSYFLGKQIDNKFRSVLRHDKRGLVSAVFAADTIRAAIPKTGDTEDNATTQLGQRLQQCEVDIVQHFIKAYCSEDLYDRFKFHDFFRSKAADQSAVIQLDDSERVNISILQTCLETLCDTEKASDTKFAVLREYAAMWLAQHLRDVDLFGPDQKSLQAIGKRLATLLYDENAIKTWWAPDLTFSLRYDWLQEEDYLQKLVDFLKHPPVLASMDEHPQSLWVKAKLDEEGSNARVLIRVAEKLADRWFTAVREDMGIFYSGQRIMAKIWSTNYEYSVWADLTAEDIRQYVKFAREKSTRGLNDLHWETRTASALHAFDHPSEALEACNQAERVADGPLPWPLLLVKAKIHFKQKSFQDALTCLHKMVEGNQLTGNTDSEYLQAYWDTALLLEGQCHKALLENEAAIECFVKLLKHQLGKDDNLSAHDEAVTELFDTWRQMKHYHHIVNHMQAWKKPEDEKLDLHYWLPRLAYEDRFHRLVVLAAVQTKAEGTHTAVGQLYDEAIQRLYEHKDEDSSDDNAEQLRYVRASILFHGSTDPSDRNKAIMMWEKLMKVKEEVEYCTWTNYVSVRTLARSLLDQGLADRSGMRQGSDTEREAASTRLEETVKRLEALTTENTPALNTCRGGNSDPRLCLARLKLKIGDEEGFKRIMMARLQKQFDKWPQSTETEVLVQRYSSIAHTLTVADDDKNALAAWHMIALPGKTPEKTGDEEAVSINGTMTDGSDTAQAEPGATKGEDAPQDLDGQNANPTEADDKVSSGEVVLGASETDDKPETNGTVSDKPATNGEVASSEESAKDEELPFAAKSPYRCDGDCGTEWPVVENTYACKNCLDVQLCPDCHTKLMDDELPPMICSPTHEHLYIPTMDRAAWAKIEPDEMIVGGEVVKKDAWLDGLRDKWDLKQEQINARRSRAAARFRAVVGAYVLSMKGYHKDAYKDDPGRIELVDGVYKWV